MKIGNLLKEIHTISDCLMFVSKRNMIGTWLTGAWAKFLVRRYNKGFTDEDFLKTNSFPFFLEEISIK